ncbi:hypothetical protein BDB00DRAFT_772882 [Zychaea mexicana]|uniref:uncharacterized protein n=1 Tax=Zychaea mexicana TaxID=64656 RepID=UPI0022FE6B72|nr:uncharacterized protein BDB00DRAFT_772882 [Zychaea mexicana]KAI9488249.1 hypothetical protein BDB00DRAFT_772882 [Zychaea mexicana]
MKKTAENKPSKSHSSQLQQQQQASAISRQVLKPGAPSSSAQAESSSGSSNGRTLLRRTESDSAQVAPRQKTAQPLRSSKISQKLVLFPPKSVEPSAVGLENVLPSPTKPELNHFEHLHEEEEEERRQRQRQQQDWQQQQQHEGWSPSNEERETAEILRPSYGYRTEAEYMTQDERDLANLPRVTAYSTGEGYSLGPLRQFLRQHHRVTPRLYDECLYAAYHFPLLTMRPGKENLLNVRVRSASPLTESISDDSEMDYDEDTYEQNGMDTVGSHLHEHDEDIAVSPVRHYNSSSHNGRLQSSISAPVSPVKEDIPTSPIATMATEAPTTTAEPSAITPTTPRRDSIFSGGEVFLFDYGVVVFWNFNRAQEILMLEDFAQFSLRPFRDNPDEDMQIEEMHFQYDVSQVKPRIFNDMITLKSSNHMIKLTLSHGLSQSATGRLVKNRVEITKVNGQLFSLRMNVNLVSNVLDTPEIFWSEPALQPMYNAIRDYLEVPQRAKILNDRLKVISDLLSMLRDHLTNFGVEYQTLIIIYLIIIAVIVACFEIAVKVLQTMRVL